MVILELLEFSISYTLYTLHVLRNNEMGLYFLKDLLCNKIDYRFCAYMDSFEFSLIHSHNYTYSNMQIYVIIKYILYLKL